MADKKSTTPRRQRTDEERIADLEAQLRAVRDKGAAKDRKRHAVLTEQRDKLIGRINELVNKRDAINKEIEQIEARTEISAPAAESTEG